MFLLSLYHSILYPAGWLAGLLMLLFLPRLKTPGATPKRRISVIIPARDEEENIKGILEDLKRQTLPPHEIICVDDESSDGTAAAARERGAAVVEPNARPEGWVGKTWACQTGAQHAAGELLLFLDADVRLSSTALAALALAFEDGAKVISVQPYHTVRKPYEYFSMFFNMVTVAATGLGMPFIKPTGMFGPVLMLERELYLRHGGHETVKSKVLEDFFLGKYYTEKDIAPSLYIGRGEIAYRMYRGGFRDLWQGWTKNFFTGAMSVSVPMLLLSVLWITGLTGAFISLVKAAAVMSPAFWAGLGVYAAFALQVGFNARKVGAFHPLAAAFYPVFLLGFHVIFLASVVKRVFFRSVTWKGRKIRTGRH